MTPLLDGSRVALVLPGPEVRRWRDRMDRIGVDRVVEAVLLARSRYPRAAEGPAFSPR